MSVKQSLLQVAHAGENWERAQQNLYAARQTLRRAVQTAVGLYAVVALLVQPLTLLQPWLPALRLAALTLIFAIFAACFVRVHVRAMTTPALPLGPDRRFTLGVLVPVCGFVLGLTAWAAVTMPMDLRPAGMQELPAFPPVLAILMPAATAAFFTWQVRPHSVPARLLGLTNLLSLREVLVGAAAGACLGLHFWITSRAWLPTQPLLHVSFTDLVWLLCFSLGLQALSEEIFFRGALYRLFEAPGEALGVGFAPILLLNAFVYLLPGLVTVLPDVWPWRLVYGLAFALLATALRRRDGSLAGPIAANVVFTVLFTLRGAV